MSNPEPQPNIILNVPDGSPDFRTGITLTIREPVYDTDKEKEVNEIGKDDEDKDDEDKDDEDKDDEDKDDNEKDDNEKEVNKDDNEEEWNEMDEETKMIWKLAIT